MPHVMPVAFAEKAPTAPSTSPTTAKSRLAMNPKERKIMATSRGPGGPIVCRRHDDDNDKYPDHCDDRHEGNDDRRNPQRSTPLWRRRTAIPISAKIVEVVVVFVAPTHQFPPNFSCADPLRSMLRSAVSRTTSFPSRTDPRQPSIIRNDKNPHLFRLPRLDRIHATVIYDPFHVLARVKVHLPPSTAPHRMIAWPGSHVNRSLGAIVLQKRNHFFRMIAQP